MPEVDEFSFTPREVLELLIKKQDIHEGIWGLRFKYAAIGSEIPYKKGEKTERVPGIVLMIPRFVLHKMDKEEAGSADAAEVNPQK